MSHKVKALLVVSGALLATYAIAQEFLNANRSASRTARTTVVGSAVLCA